MKKCQNPDHPHCTQWVLPGSAVCGAQHPQPPQEGAAAELPALTVARKDVLQAASLGLAVAAPSPAQPRPVTPGYKTQAAQAHLHISGYDPRAAGGRQSLRLQLHGVIAPPGEEIHLLARSELLAGGQCNERFVRAAGAEWRSILLPFSARGKVHGQYAIELELVLHSQRVRRRWACTLVILIPRQDASLAEIGQSFLSTHKNVRIHASEGALAHVQGLAGSDNLALEIHAERGALAQLDLAALVPPGKPVPSGIASIAWDEDLVEIEHVELHTQVDAGTRQQACISTNSDGLIARLRLFAQQDFLLGRWQIENNPADIRLAQYVNARFCLDAYTRRISAEHARIHTGGRGFLIEDLSRFGLLINGEWPGKYKPVALAQGMQLELSHSFRGIVQLEVAALSAHMLLLRRADQGRLAECFYLLKPETRPDSAASLHNLGLPVLFHWQGDFWHWDAGSGKATRLPKNGKPGGLADLAPNSVIEDQAYPEQAEVMPPIQYEGTVR